MASPASVAATAVLGLFELLDRAKKWAEQKKAADQAEGQRIVEQMQADTAEIDRRAREAGRKP